MKGLLSSSVNIFHSDPNLLEISELCILGLSWAIFRRCSLDQTMKAFMGLDIAIMCDMVVQVHHERHDWDHDGVISARAGIQMLRKARSCVIVVP